jgi:hypothetical protein
VEASALLRQKLESRQLGQQGIRMKITNARKLQSYFLVGLAGLSGTGLQMDAGRHTGHHSFEVIAVHTPGAALADGSGSVSVAHEVTHYHDAERGRGIAHSRLSLTSRRRCEIYIEFNFGRRTIACHSFFGCLD